MSQECEVKVRFFPPPDQLRRFFTTFYFAEWTLPPGEVLTDRLLPEWANLRFLSGKLNYAQSLSGSRIEGAGFAATGPSSLAMPFEIGSSRMWGIGLLPLGWSKFVGVPAAGLADTLVDGLTHPAYASFAGLGRAILAGGRDTRAEFAMIAAHFLGRLDDPVPDEARIVAIHTALVDPETGSVGHLAEKAGESSRTIERLCKRHFGFAPKVLLRRQRFMRSLSHFLLDPTLKWIGAIDGHYHDQAQFVHDFRQFMGMSPRQYAAMPRPIIDAVMRERARFFTSAVQALDSPDGPSRPS